jgi:hypothetical protein
MGYPSKNPSRRLVTDDGNKFDGLPDPARKAACEAEYRGI